jgi:general secretion pathway protein M
LKEVIESDGGELTSMQLLPARDEEGFQRVAIAITLSTTIASLQQILYAIEGQSPYLFIEDIEVTADQAIAEDSQSPENRNLQVHLEVFGYMPGQARS